MDSSIGTDNSVAGSSVAVTEAAEDASFAPSVTGRMVMDGMSVVGTGGDGEANVAPGHFHALRYEASLADVQRGSVVTYLSN